MAAKLPTPPGGVTTVEIGSLGRSAAAGPSTLAGVAVVQIGLTSAAVGAAGLPGTWPPLWTVPRWGPTTAARHATTRVATTATHAVRPDRNLPDSLLSVILGAHRATSIAEIPGGRPSPPWTGATVDEAGPESVRSAGRWTGERMRHRRSGQRVTTTLPVFPPLKRRLRASPARSSPTTTCSRWWIRPSITQPAISSWASGNRSR